MNKMLKITYVLYREFNGQYMIQSIFLSNHFSLTKTSNSSEKLQYEFRVHGYNTMIGNPNSLSMKSLVKKTYALVTQSPPNRVAHLRFRPSFF